MKRILVLLSVVALMVVMVAMSVAPAFAAATYNDYGCRTGDSFYTEAYFSGGYHDHNGDRITCGYYTFNNDKWRDADNHLNQVA